VKEQADQPKQEQQHTAEGTQEEAMQQLQQTPEQADVPQALADLPQPNLPLVGEDGVTMWLSFWAEVGY
jgi:hypothetical protein